VADQRGHRAASGCPDPEALAAYLDGTATPSERAAMTEHLADCEDCYLVFAESARMRIAEPAPSRLARLTQLSRAAVAAPAWSKAAAAIGGLAAAAALTFAVQPQLAPPWWPGRSEMVELVAAVGSGRTFEPRLTGGFAYGPVVEAPVVRAGERPEETLPADLRLASVSLEKRLLERRTAPNLHAYGAALMFMGRSDQAIASIEEAIRLAPANPRYNADLAAAYLVRFKQKKDIADVTKAIGAATTAVDADRSLPEARFNLALALEALSLREEARKAWTEYLALDAKSAWAQEARRHVEALGADKQSQRIEDEKRQIADAVAGTDRAALFGVVARLPDVAGSYGENTLLPEWADAVAAGDVTRANEQLDRAERLGQALSDATGERMLIDAAGAARAATREGRAMSLASGHRTFQKARALFNDDRVADAARLFADARVELAAAASPLAEWTGLYAAIASYYRNRFDDAVAALAPVRDAAAAHQHLMLLGRTLRMTGLIHHVSGRIGPALDDYQAALTAFDKAHGRDEVTAMHSSMAEILAQVGDSRTAWLHRGKALEGLGALSSARTRGTILQSSGLMAQRDGLLATALALQNEMLAESLRTDKAGPILAAYHDRAEVYRRLGADDAAQRDLAEADRWLARVPDPSLASRHEAELKLARAEVIQQRDPMRAIELLQQSGAYFRDHSLDQRLARVYLLLGQLQRQASRPDEAEATFAAGLRVLERQRPLLPDGRIRLGYFELPWNLFDEMIALVASQPGKERAALAYAERSRARDLLDAASATRSAEPIDPATMAATLAPGTALLYYASLRDELLTWLVTRGGVSFHRTPIGAAALAQDVAAFRDALSSPWEQDTSALQARLYAAILGPVADRLTHGETLAFVADGPLHTLPFAALRDPATNRYLVEDHAIEIAPSASMFVRRRDGRPLDGASARALVFGNPRAAGDESAVLPNLAQAEAEAKEIAQLFPGSVVLTGADATKRAFVDAAGRHAIVHFAGHAIANGDNPLLSRLLFASSDATRADLLFANEILSVDTHGTALVVLAACRTAVSALRKGEGAIGLARPFLATGVPSVVATMWDIDDQASRYFFRVFYTSLKSGGAPAAALRTAQLEMLRLADPRLRAPLAWAGFTLYGRE
jgi:CHAT domain-containing protein